VHEIRLDGYRMAARIDSGRDAIAHPDRPGLERQYPSALAAPASPNVKTAYIDDELCGVDDAGLPSFAQTQAATDGGAACTSSITLSISCTLADGTSRACRWLGAKRCSSHWVSNKPGLQFNGRHDTGDGELILKHAGKLGFEGAVSKTIDAPYAPGNRGLGANPKH
jgi:ATP-dependent DNA ligase